MNFKAVSSRMKVRCRWLNKIFLLLIISIITYLYQKIKFYRTENSLRITFGEKLSISYRHVEKEHGYDEQNSKVNSPLPRLVVNILVWSPSLTLANQTKNIEVKLFPAYGKPRNKCPIKYTFVSGKEQEDYVDAIIIDAKQPGSLPKKKKKIPWILHYDEPPTISKNLENETFMKYFNYSIGYRMDSDFPNPVISQPVISDPLHFYQRYDYAAAVFSTCNGIRTKYVQEFSKYFRIKSYGDCLRNVERNNILERGENTFLDSKIKLLKMHKFAFAMMQFDCEDYIDETLNHAWKAGVLPIYLGTDSLQRILPAYLRTSFVPVSKFGTPKDLAIYLTTLLNDEVEYSKMTAWTNKSKVSKDDSPLSEIWNPKFSAGCKIALTLRKDRLTIRRNKTKTLRPIFCKERSVHHWLGK